MILKALILTITLFTSSQGFSSCKSYVDSVRFPSKLLWKIYGQKKLSNKIDKIEFDQITSLKNELLKTSDFSLVDYREIEHIMAMIEYLVAKKKLRPFEFKSFLQTTQGWTQLKTITILHKKTWEKGFDETQFDQLMNQLTILMYGPPMKIQDIGQKQKIIEAQIQLIQNRILKDGIYKSLETAGKIKKKNLDI